MFKTPKWSSDEEDNVVSKKKKSQAQVPDIMVTHPTDVSISSTESGKKKKKKKKKSEKEALQSGKVPNLASQLFKKIDRAMKSPTMTNELLETGVKAKCDRNEDQSSSRKKMKKSLSSSLSSLTDAVSESASQFISGKSHKKKKKKKKNNSESGDHDESTNSVNTTTDASEKDKSESPKKKKKKKKKSQNEDEADSRSEEKGQKRKATENGDIVATTTPAKKANFNIEKLKEALGKTDSTPASASKANTGVDDAKSRLKSSQFRFLNEKLYSQNGAQSLKMFSADKDAFRIYHEGYLEQLKKWPMDPLNIIINSIIKVSGNPVVADFGCGEARLARAIASSCGKIHSFDLVAANELVTVCDMTHTSLEPSSVDIAVFCLSLMGTNLRDYIKEANRVLKDGGVLKIAEVESRFQEFPVDEFVNSVERCGFKLKWKDLSNKYFYLMDFVKTGDCKKKVQEFKLKPCFYKKR